MTLYVYALAGDAGGPATGLQGEPVRWLEAGGIFAAIGQLEAAPAVEATAVQGHDTAVRELARGVKGLLPARFGSVVPDLEALAQTLRPQLPALREALRLVEGREQMTLRLFGPEPAPEPAPMVKPEGPGAGTRYLQARQQAERARHQAPELEPLRAVLAGLVHAERIERGGRPGLRVSAYHLVASGQAARYREVIAQAQGALAPLKVSVSGPWPAYAFAPGETR